MTVPDARRQPPLYFNVFRSQLVSLLFDRWTIVIPARKSTARVVDFRPDFNCNGEFPREQSNIVLFICPVHTLPLPIKRRPLPSF